MITISPKLVAELKVLGLVAIIILFSFTTVAPKQMMIAYSQLQLNADTICVLNPEQCDEARQQEFSDAIERGMQEQFAEDYRERTGEDPPTTDELMGSADEEGDLDDEREAEMYNENGIPINEETGDPIPLSEEVRPRDYDTEFASRFLNTTFSRITNVPPTEEETDTVQVDLDEGEEEDNAEIKTTYYEFNPDTEADDVRIYAPPQHTSSTIATFLATNFNSTEITLYDNGRATIYCEGPESFDDNDDIWLFVPHNYTSAAGYRYQNDTIISPTGEQLLSTEYGLHGLEDYTTPSATAQEC
jgi:hypothetical protein